MEELTRIRNERGWTQKQLAAESGVDKATINQIERGKRSPNVETLDKLARAMDAEIGDFFPKAQGALFPLEGADVRVSGWDGSGAGGFVGPEVADDVLRLWELIVAGWDSELRDRLEADDEEWFERMTAMFEVYTGILSGLDMTRLRDPKRAHERIRYMLDFNARLADSVDPEYRHRFGLILEGSAERMKELVASD